MEPIEIPQRAPTEDELDLQDNILHMLREEPRTSNQLWDSLKGHLQALGKNTFRTAVWQLIGNDTLELGVGNVLRITEPPKSLEERLRLSKIVYSWVMPETEQMVQEITGSEHQILLRDRHREAWTSKQDKYHKEFFDTWMMWAADKVATPYWFSHKYPTAGSSEAIRETLAQHASLAQYQPHKGLPTIHVFEGEYEGYKAMAKPYGIRVVEHDRSKWRKSLEEFVGRESTDGHKWYLSNPSSIDGNFWEDYHYFLGVVHEHTDIKVMLDLCYIGSVPEVSYPSQRIDARHDVIDTVFFSLSKVFGVYYHRVGGMFSRTEHPGLWGNKWFKNLSSLYLGTQLMKRYHLTELPDKYRDLQYDVIRDMEPALKDSHHIVEDIFGSDVLLLAHQRIKRHSPYEGHFDRLPNQPRYCLTQRLYEKCAERGDYDH